MLLVIIFYIFQKILIVATTVFVTGNIALSVFLSIHGILTVLQSVIFVCCFFILCITNFQPLERFASGTTDAAKQNSSLIYSFLRLITISVTLYICASGAESSITSYAEFDGARLLLQMRDYEEVYLIITVILCGIVLQFHNFAKYAKRKTKFVFIIPSYLSCIAVAIIDVVICHIDITGMPFLKDKHCDIFSNTTWENIATYIISSVLFIVMFLTIALNSNDFDHRDSEKEMNNSVILIMDNVVSHFLDFSEQVSKDNSHKTRTRIFVCTTMYQEAKHEMNRLLNSINKLSNRSEFIERDIYLESHIFLDNGASGREVNEFGIQLLALIEHNMETEDQYGNMKYTPYGIQLSWHIPGKLPLYIHLKDNMKVKAKKRWSQVMYMHYVMEYRAKYLERESMLRTPMSDSLESLDVGIFMDSPPSSTSGSHSNTLQVPKVTFDMGSKTSSYSSLTTICNLDDNDEVQESNGKTDITFTQTLGENLKENAFKSDDTLALDVKSLGDGYISDSRADDMFTEVSFKFDAKSVTSSQNLDGADIYTISEHDKEDYYKPVKYDDYILATDADMSFDVDSVVNLVNTCQKNPEVGGVCGRTHPIGLHWHPIIWLQMFDYAKGSYVFLYHLHVFVKIF